MILGLTEVQIGVALGAALGAAFVRGLAGLPGEIGHLGIPIGFADRLPALVCKCGRIGCYETLVSGPGASKALPVRP